MKPKLCIALDTEKDKALKLEEALKGYPLIYKVGYKLFLPYGPKIVEEIQKTSEGGEIFLDLKLHDIPNTVRNGVTEVSRIGVEYLTLHTLGGSEMVKAASSVKGDTKLLGVTLLTSHDEDYLKFLEIPLSKEEFILRLAQVGIEGGCDGLVCSAHEVGFLKRELGREFIAVVPGIRLEKKLNDDQRRIATPEEALERGADILVVGRPILNAEKPIQIVEKLLKLLGY